MTIVVLTGMMGTGKTAVGERLATRLGAAFVDTDALVERAAGRSVAEIFATAGEAAFRAAERRAIADALAVPRAVVSTGGGAIVDPDNLAALRAAAPIVCLTARPEVILERARAARVVRPLLQGDDPAARLAALLAERAAAYAQADLTLDTSGRGVDDVVADVLAFLRRRGGSEIPA
ncbi:AAA family ATPase [bacterium]|nr:AAA family ATPase [bacterium]